MQIIGVSVALTLALATLANGLPSYSPDCTVCPSCLNDVHHCYEYPVTDICSFCQCLDGKNTTVKCPSGQKFNADKGGCVPDDTGLCTPCCDDCCKNKCPICYHGIDFPIPNPDKCKWCLCAKDGNIYTESCKHGFRYNETSGYCDIPDPECGDCPGVVCDVNSDVEQHFQDLNSKDNCDFCCCHPNSSTVFHSRCPWGEKFIDGTCDSSTKGQCDASRSAELVPVDPCHDVVCPVNPAKALLQPIASIPTSYCKCELGARAQKYDCPPGSVFFAKLRACVPMKTGKSLERTFSDCDHVYCPVSPIGVPLYPDPVNDAAYCQCDWGGRVHPMPCAPGTIFNFYYQTCL